MILVKRDAFRFFPPLKHYMAERLLAGELPEWFPYESLGRSFIASPMSGMFHPFTLLYLALPVHEALRLATILSCVAAGVGAFALGRRLKFSRAAAVVAGVAFACSGYVASMTEAIVYLYSICLLPFFVVAIDLALSGRVVWGVVAAGTWASVLLNGDMQYGYYYGFIALLWSVMRTDGPKWKAVLRVLCIAAVAALVAGVQLAPSAVAFLASDRSDPEAFHDIAVVWSTHPLRLLTLVIAPISQEVNMPDIAHFFFGSPPVGGSPAGYWADSVYVGVPVLVLTFLGARFRQDLRPLVVLGAVAVWLALGRYGGLYDVFYHTVPFWSAFRYPEKLMGVVSFALAILAGGGVDLVRKGHGASAPWFALGGGCAVLWGGVRSEHFGTWIDAVSLAPATLLREAADFSAQSFLFDAVAAVGVGLLVLTLRQGRLPQTVSLGLLILLVTGDLSRANHDVYYTAPVETATFIPGLAEAVKRHASLQHVDKFRVFSFPATEIPYPPAIQRTLSPVGATSLMLRQSLQPDISADLGVESVNVYIAGHTHALGQLRSLVSRSSWMSVYARFNVAYFVGLRKHFLAQPFSESLVAFIPLYDLALVKNPVQHSPRVYLSRLPQRAAAPVDMVTLSENREFLDGIADVIETPDHDLPGPARDGAASIQHYAPEEVRVHVEAPRSVVLILNDAHETGWQAVLEDGRVRPVLRANGLVRAVTVPAGAHTVTFTYRTPLLVLGAWLSCAGLALCVGLVLIGRRQDLTSLLRADYTGCAAPELPPPLHTA